MKIIFRSRSAISSMLACAAVALSLVVFSAQSNAQEASERATVKAADKQTQGANKTGTSAPSASASSKKTDPQGVTGLSPEFALIAKGNAASVAGDSEGAIQAYRESIKVNPNFPLGHLLLGQVFANQKKYTKASESYKAAQRYAPKNIHVQAKSLFLQADLFERQAHWGNAINAWKAYEEFIKRQPKSKSFPQTAQQRIKALEKREEMAVKYDAVRKRIEQRVQETSSAASAK